MSAQRARTGDYRAKLVHEEVIVRIRKPHYDAILANLNRHPYYEDVQEFILKAVRQPNLDQVVFQEIRKA